jgi:putative YhbY family RNA-binding protein
MANQLAPAQRQALKARAHALNPVVLIGNAGLTASVLAEVERALDSHELIKIRVMGRDRDERDEMLGEVCGATGATPVQHIGKVIVIFRERAEEPAPKETPPRAPRKEAKPARRALPRRSQAPARFSEKRPASVRRGKLRPR